jgi:hypothetical protein
MTTSPPSEEQVPGIRWDQDQKRPSIWDPWAHGLSEVGAPRLSMEESMSAEGGRNLVADPTGEPLISSAEMSKAWGALRALQAGEGSGAVWREALPLFLNPDPGVRAHALETVLNLRGPEGEPAARLELQLWWEGGILPPNPHLPRGGSWARPMSLPWGPLPQDCPELWTAERPPFTLEGRSLSHQDARIRDQWMWPQAVLRGSGLAWGRVLGALCLPSEVPHSEVGLPPYHFHIKPRVPEGWGPLSRVNQNLQGALYDELQGKTLLGSTFLRNVSLRCVLVSSSRFSNGGCWARDEDLLPNVTISRRGLLSLEMFLSWAMASARQKGGLRSVYQNQQQVWAQALQTEAAQTYTGPPSNPRRFRASARPWEVYQNAFFPVRLEYDISDPSGEPLLYPPVFLPLNGGSTVQHHGSHSRLRVALSDGLDFNSELPPIRNLPPGANPELFDMVAGFMIGQQLEGHNPRFKQRG